MLSTVRVSLFSPTLYVGEHDHGLYAMPSLVDEETLTIAPSSTGPLLLEGPQNIDMPDEIELRGIRGSRSPRGDTDPLGIPLPGDGQHRGQHEKKSVLLFGERLILSRSFSFTLFVALILVLSS